MRCAALGRQALETAQPDDSVDERLAALEPTNVGDGTEPELARFRSVGYDADAAHKFRTIAEKQIMAIHQKHGWPLPPTSMPGVTVLD